MKHLFTFFTCLLAASCFAQNTLGTITYNPVLTQPGYNLYYPQGQGSVWLLDNCGRVVNQWLEADQRASLAGYLVEGGHLLVCARDPINPIPGFGGGGSGQYVIKKDWDNNVVWQFEYATTSVRMHHDVEYMPNGNVLIIAYEVKTPAEATAAGRDPNTTPGLGLYPDHIVEVEPVGLDSGNIVWEWHAWDHLIQQFDPGQDNFGMVADHPELIDINYNSSLTSDMMHTNSIDYNAELDQILLSVPAYDEIWIIDHSTTTTEAAGHAGGNSGMGGDLLYRWGNPAAYRRVGVANQALLDFQHDAEWLGPGLNAGDPDIGKILIFNNQIGGNYSQVELITPPWNGTEYVLDPVEPFEPIETDWTYTDPILPTNFFSGGQSCSQRLRNGNYLLMPTQQGRAIEVDPSNNSTVWEYRSPLINGIFQSEGSTNTGSGCFRFERYPVQSFELQGQDLTPGGYLEIGEDGMLCASIGTVGITEQLQEGLRLFPNPAVDRVEVIVPNDLQYLLLDTQGRNIKSGLLRAGRNDLDVSGLPNGTYLLRAEASVIKFIVQH